MGTITVLPDAQRGGVRAVSGNHLSVGDTVGAALDGLSAELGPTRQTTLVVVQPMAPDAFFTADQQRRLGDLMARWRAAREDGRTLPADDQTELNGLIEAEVKGATARAAELLSRLPS